MNDRDNLSKAVQNYIKEFFRMHEGSDPESGLHECIMNEIERVLIQETLVHCDNVQTKAAKILGLSRNTLRNKIQSHKLE